MVDLEHIAKSCGGAVRSGSGWLCRCPAHDDSKPSLSLSYSRYGDKLLAKCHAGCDFLDIIAALRDLRLLEDTYHHDDMPEPTPHEKNDYAIQLWDNAQKADGTHVETYLNARGCVLSVPPSLRYNACLKHTPSGREFPAMIAGICKYPSAEIIAIHRTYLNFEGTAKAPVENAKMMLGASSGGAVRFGACEGDVLWVAEGIETALSLYLATGQPTWATLSTSGMKAVVLPPPDLVPNLRIAADHDAPGIDAAQALAAREMAIGRDVRIDVPPVPGQDFNDVLREAAYVG